MNDAGRDSLQIAIKMWWWGNKEMYIFMMGNGKE